MIATIQTKNPHQFAFRAMIHGLHVDPVAEGIIDVTYRDGYQLLAVIREAGGTIIAKTRRQPLSKAERFRK